MFSVQSFGSAAGPAHVTPPTCTPGKVRATRPRFVDIFTSKNLRFFPRSPFMPFHHTTALYSPHRNTSPFCTTATPCTIHRLQPEYRQLNAVDAARPLPLVLCRTALWKHYKNCLYMNFSPGPRYTFLDKASMTRM